MDSQRRSSIMTQSTEAEENLAELTDMFKSLLINMVRRARDDLLSSGGHHLNITCNCCQNSDFQDIRYKCLICDDFDLCGQCYEKEFENNLHKKNHLVLYIPQPLTKEVNLKISDMIKNLNYGDFSYITHRDTRCDDCDTSPIQGIRVKCDECVDFDLCYICYKNSLQIKKEIKKHITNHSMIAYLQENILLYQYDDIEFLSDKIGSGCFGSVRKARIKSIDQVVACKVLEIKRGNTQQTLKLYKSFYNEINAYKELRSKYIVRYYGYSQQQKDQIIYIYILMEFINGGTLQDFVKENKISFRRKLSLINDIIKGVRRIHQKKFIHKDLKPDNILITSSQQAKITDMGIAIYQEGFSENYCIAPIQWSAPELRVGNRKTQFSSAVDIYSLGLLINYLFTNKTHNFDLSSNQIKIQIGEFFPMLINRCLEKDHQKRPSIQELENIFKQCDQDFWKWLPINTKQYVQLKEEVKNLLFIKFYREWKVDKII